MLSQSFHRHYNNNINAILLVKIMYLFILIKSERRQEEVQ